MMYPCTWSGRENNECSGKWGIQIDTEVYKDLMGSDFPAKEQWKRLAKKRHLSSATGKWKELPWESELRLGSMRQGPL
jgi:hypothetical protein